MRITHIISAPAAGGAEVYVKDLAIAMQAEGHEVFVLFVNSASEIARDPIYERRFIENLTAGKVSCGFVGAGRRRNPLAGVRSVRAHVRVWRPQIVHAHLYYGALFASFCGAPVVYTHHSILLGAPRSLYRFLNWRIRAFVAICHATQRVLENVCRRPVVRIDNGVDPERLIPRRANGVVSARGPALVAVGSLIPLKNYPLMLRAAARLGDLDFELNIAGEGPERANLEQVARDLGLSGKVRFLGNVSDVPGLLSRSDVFVMSSSQEGLPISLIEASMSGLPVVVTNVGGCAEVVHRVCNGIVIDGEDEADLSDALRRLVESSEQRGMFAHNATLFASYYDLKRSVSRHLALYQDLATADTEVWP